MEKAKKTLEELVEKSQKALENPRLVEIVKTAPKNKDGRVNLSWAHEQAFQYVYEQTKDLQKAKELAVSTRWLAMLRRDYEEEFEKLVSPKTEQLKVQAEKEEKGRALWEIDFPLPENFVLTTTDWYKGEPDVSFTRQLSLRFGVTSRRYDWEQRTKFCIDLLKGFCDGSDVPYESKIKLRDFLIQTLEEKFGLKVKVCGNCKHLTKLGEELHCWWPVFTGSLIRGIRDKTGSCENWAPKEVLEEQEKVCRTCACGIKRIEEDPDKNESYMCGGDLLKQCVVSGQCDQWKE